LHSCLNYKDQVSEADREDYENAMKAAVHRNEGLQRFVSSIADVVRVPPPLREECDLHSLLREIHMLMNAEAGKRNIGWDWQLHDGAFLVRIDVQQMEQVLVNVMKNALEAIGEDGTITVITCESPERTLIIRDNGKGIPAEVQPHIFTPFFSTKKDGKGIGLTLIREILMGHGFGFSLETVEGDFTDFRIEF
jgi:signal transduction histidine kinase